MSQDAYRNVAGIYDRLFDPLNAGLRAIGLKLLPPTAGMRVLDVGCGTGAQLERYRDAGCAVAGVDTSPAMLDVARARLGEEADLRLADASALPWDDASFDLVTSTLVLHEMDPPVRQAVLADVRRVLAGGGHALLIDFRAGRPRSLKGWAFKPFITVVELLAGWRHFRNCRRFLAAGGLPAMLRSAGLTVVNERIVAGGALALYLARAG